MLSSFVNMKNYCCRGSNSTSVTCAYALWWLSDLGHGPSGELLRKYIEEWEREY